MRPILLQGHERSLTQIKYTRDGDILFSTAKDQVVCAWFSANGERLGTYHGHQGALWTIDVDPTTTMLATGAADNTVKLWDVKTGKCLKTWEFPTAVKRVEFNEDGTQLLAVTEKRMGYLGTIVVFDIDINVDAEQSDEPTLKITCEDSKATVAGWSYLSKYIIAGHEDGSVSQYDGKVRCSRSGPRRRPTDSRVDWRTTQQCTGPRSRSSGDRSPMGTRPDILHYCVQG